MNIQFIRHATLIVSINGKKILIDPVLSPKGAISPIPNVPLQSQNPLVDLPLPLDTILDCDGVLITHTHRDHFDTKAISLIPKNMRIFCQPADASKLKELGFRHTSSIKTSLQWEGIQINRTRGKHGHGLLAFKMAPVSGFILTAPNEPVIYIMGDTIWCSHTRRIIKQYRPEIIISNCGEARFACGRPITMTTHDILSVCHASPLAKIVTVHMESWNHCRLSRQTLRTFAIQHGIENQIYIPDDGEFLAL
jgi:L-ascorbate metabolism protein UlaG (beta-lactamase superfamily)